MVNSIIFKNFLSVLQDWQFVQLGEQQNFGIKTAGLEDKATACQMLVCYARLVGAVPPGWFCLFHKTLARVRPPPVPLPAFSQTLLPGGWVVNQSAPSSRAVSG